MQLKYISTHFHARISSCNSACVVSVCGVVYDVMLSCEGVFFMYVYELQCMYLNMHVSACVFTGHLSLRQKGWRPGPCGCLSCHRCRPSRWACGWTRGVRGCRPVGKAGAPARLGQRWSLGARRSASWTPCRSHRRAALSWRGKRDRIRSSIIITIMQNISGAVHCSTTGFTFQILLKGTYYAFSSFLLFIYCYDGYLC